MRKVIVLLMAMVMIWCSSCGKEEVPATTIEPQVSQMKSICELATMDCYYHNVAKYTEEDAEGILWWKKDKHFWIEYSGVVTIGVDASLVNIEVTDEQVTITIPPAKVLDCKVDESTLSEDSFIVDKDSADINAEDQTEAFREAQSNMQQAAAEDLTLLANAQQRAQKLLEDYVNNIGNSVGKQYKIMWVYVDEGGNELNNTVVGTAETDSSETKVEE